MADLPTLFSESAASRIGAATRWAELQQGLPTDGYGSSPGNAMCLVRTRATLPTGYSGAMAALADVVEKQPDGSVITLGAVWVKDINGGTLSANTIYQARVGGTFSQNTTTNGVTTPTTLGLYLVQTGGGGGGSGLVVGSIITGNFSGTNLTYFDINNQLINFTLVNAIPKYIQFSWTRKVIAEVIDPVAKKARYLYFTPVFYTEICYKPEQYRVVIKSTYQEIYDLSNTAILQYSTFSGLLWQSGDPDMPPLLIRYDGYVPQWSAGIGSGIGPGISGV